LRERQPQSRLRRFPLAMKRSLSMTFTILSRAPLLALSIAVTLLASPLAGAQNEQGQDSQRGDRDRGRSIVTVAFGAGLNTAQPGNEQNHHILPNVIRVRAGDVVSFVVSGLHVIRVYDKGVQLRDVKAQIPDECEVNPTPPAEFPANCFTQGPVAVIPPLGLDVLYEGLNSIGPPPQVPPFAPLSLAQNRVEAVSFLSPGRYLVICAVLEHFNDGMYAVVEVSGRDQGRS
jgi:plastocyanin